MYVTAGPDDFMVILSISQNILGIVKKKKKKLLKSYIMSRLSRFCEGVGIHKTCCVFIPD